MSEMGGGRGREGSDGMWRGGKREEIHRRKVRKKIEGVEWKSCEWNGKWKRWRGQ